MEEGSIHFGVQAPVICGMCDGHDEVLWYCKNCDGKLCMQCKENHGKKTIFRKHIIIPLIEALKQISEDLESCDKHQDKCFTLHCNECRTLICADCATEDHSGHKLGKIPVAMEMVCKELQEYLDKLETGLLVQYRAQKENITMNVEFCKKWLAEIETEVEKKQKHLISEIDQYCNNLLVEARKQSKERLSLLNQIKQRTETSIDEISLLKTRTKEVLKMNNSEILRFQKEKPDVTKLEVPKISPMSLPTFKEGKYDDKILKEQIGTLDKRELVSGDQPTGDQFTGSISVSKSRTPAIDVEVFGKYEYKTRVRRLHATSAQGACFTFLGRAQINFVNLHGNITKVTSFNFVIEDFTFLTTDSIVTTEYGGHQVRTLTTRGQLTNGFSTSPFVTSGLCLTNDSQSVAVCLTNLANYFKIAVYSWEGKILQEIKYTDKKGHGSAYQQRIKQSKKGDYCVLNQEMNTVFVMESTGVPKFTYDDSKTTGLEKQFNPMDICYDYCNNLLIADWNNNTVHMLDQEGHLIIKLFTAYDAIIKPSAIDTDPEGKLWVGHNDRCLSIIKYLKW